ncbi:MAG: tetratricopeptide repeat protein [Bacteroidales bacterium]|nr:tetratricopeptide repeat protein [Bacteroidales bacterium]
MKHLFPILFIFCGLSVWAQSPRETFALANQAYEQGQYQQSVELYQTLIDGGYESASLYYNLGNAYYRQNEAGQALLWYERAHRLAPADRDIRENLEFVYSHTEDNIETLPQFLVVRWWNAVCSIANPRGWMTILIVVLFLLGGAVVLFFLARSYQMRKAGLIASGVMTLVMMLCVGLTVSSSFSAHSRSEAIVTAPMSVIKSSPDQGSVDKFILHEGSKVKISDRVDSWLKVTIADGSKGWVSESDITII